MTEEAFYGEALPRLRAAQRRLLELIGQYPEPEDDDRSVIVYCRSRIKSPDSMIAKLTGRGLTPNTFNALEQVHDALGVRIVCGFVDDVYRVAQWLDEQAGTETIRVKDYMAYPKPSGYRSYHMIVRLREGAGAGVMAEVQIRTMATDCWATLEHRMKYKHDVANEEMIRQELKRCADEIASTDLSMQTLWDILNQAAGEDGIPGEKRRGEGGSAGEAARNPQDAP